MATYRQTSPLWGAIKAWSSGLGFYTIVEFFSFGIGLWIKKEWLIPQTPSIRGRNHSYLGGTTSYGGFNGKTTVTFSFYPIPNKRKISRALSFARSL